MTDSRLRNIVHPGSRDDAILALHEASARLASLAAHIRMFVEHTDVSLALHNLTARIGHELARLAKNHDHGVDFVAWATRNTFEMNLSVRFVLLSDENALRYLSEAAKDEQQVLEGFLSLSDAAPSDLRGPLERRIAEIDAVAKRHAVALRKPLSTSELARLTGCSAEYAAMFKFMSKYIHPSSWLVNKPSDETQSDTYRNLLVAHAQIYAGDSYERTRTRLGIADRAQHPP